MIIKMIALSMFALALSPSALGQTLSAEAPAYVDALVTGLPGILMTNPVLISLQTSGDDYRTRVFKADTPGKAAYQVHVKQATR